MNQSTEQETKKATVKRRAALPQGGLRVSVRGDFRGICPAPKQKLHKLDVLRKVMYLVVL